MKNILKIQAKSLFPEIRNVIDLAFGSYYPEVNFTYLIADPWRFYLQSGIYRSPKTFSSYTQCYNEMLEHCLKLIENGKR